MKQIIAAVALAFALVAPAAAQDIDTAPTVAPSVYKQQTTPKPGAGHRPTAHHTTGVTHPHSRTRQPYQNGRAPVRQR